MSHVYDKANTGFEIRCRLCRLRVRLPCPPLIPDAENRRGIRTYLTKKPRVARGFFHFLDMPPSRSPNDRPIRFDTFCYREGSLSGTWYGTNVGTFRRFSAP